MWPFSRRCSSRYVARIDNRWEQLVRCQLTHGHTSRHCQRVGYWSRVVTWTDETAFD